MQIYFFHTIKFQMYVKCNQEESLDFEIAQTMQHKTEASQCSQSQESGRDDDWKENVSVAEQHRFSLATTAGHENKKTQRE